jgi:hypothetical protein
VRSTTDPLPLAGSLTSSYHLEGCMEGCAGDTEVLSSATRSPRAGASRLGSADRARAAPPRSEPALGRSHTLRVPHSQSLFQGEFAWARRVCLAGTQNGGFRPGQCTSVGAIRGDLGRLSRCAAATHAPRASMRFSDAGGSPQYCEQPLRAPELHSSTAIRPPPCCRGACVRLSAPALLATRSRLRVLCSQGLLDEP